MTSSTSCSRMSCVSSSSGRIGTPSGYRGPASDGGYVRSSIPGICVAVNATTSVSASSRNATLKLWKSRPPAPMMMTLRISFSFAARGAGARRRPSRSSSLHAEPDGNLPLRLLRRPQRAHRAAEDLLVEVDVLGNRLARLAPLHPHEDGDAEQQQHEPLGEPLLAGAPDRPHRVGEGEARDDG